MRSWHCLGARVAVGLLGSISLAHADGIPGSTAPPDWSGIYVGVQGGGAKADTGWFFPVDSFFTLIDGNRTFDTDPNGAFMGGHVTWNHQIGALVVGAELAINGTSLHQTRIGPFTPLFANDTFDTTITGYGTLTGRLGYACDQFLFYGTGGFARGHADFRAVSGPPGAGVVGDVQEHLNGWTAGGGVEYLLVENVVIGVEYDYVRLADKTTEIATTGTPDTTPFILNTHVIDMHAVSARLSIKLDPP